MENTTNQPAAYGSVRATSPDAPSYWGDGKTFTAHHTFYLHRYGTSRLGRWLAFRDAYAAVKAAAPRD